EGTREGERAAAGIVDDPAGAAGGDAVGHGDGAASVLERAGAGRAAEVDGAVSAERLRGSDGCDGRNRKGSALDRDRTAERIAARQGQRVAAAAAQCDRTGATDGAGVAGGGSLID